MDRYGTPLTVTLTGANRHDVTQLLPLLDAVPPTPNRRLHADRGYDFDKYRRLLWKRGIKPLIARRGVAHGSGLGKVRWVVERAFAWLHQSKRLRIRYERRADLHQGLLELACSLICLRCLRTSFVENRPVLVTWCGPARCQAPNSARRLSKTRVAPMAPNPQDPSGRSRIVRRAPYGTLFLQALIGQSSRCTAHELPGGEPGCRLITCVASVLGLLDGGAKNSWRKLSSDVEDRFPAPTDG